MGGLVAFADFGPVPGREAGARNGQERVECGPERPIRAAGEVRRNPHEYAGTGAIRQGKTPTENGWGSNIGGGGGNRTRVRKPSAVGSTCVSSLLF